MSLSTSHRRINGIYILDVSGHLVAGNAGELRERILGAFEQGNRAILVNCEEIEFVDSSGLGELVSAYASMLRRGGLLRLLSPSPKLALLLSRTRLDTLFEVHTSELAALASFTPAALARARQHLDDYLDGGAN